MFLDKHILKSVVRNCLGFLDALEAPVPLEALLALAESADKSVLQDGGAKDIINFLRWVNKTYPPCTTVKRP